MLSCSTLSSSTTLVVSKTSSISSINPGHVCSSSCPANHWMKEDEEWIDNDDASSEEENHAWFPDYSSDTSTNNDR